MKKNTEIVTVTPSRAYTAGARLRNGILAVSALALPTLASAQDTGAALNFDVNEVQTKGLAILAVGVAITIAFAVYRVGKRAAGRM